MPAALPHKLAIRGGNGLGDAIYIQTKDGWYTYRFRDFEYVTPETVDVLAAVPHHPDLAPTDRVITLTTCNPRFSAAQRLIIHADYEGASLVSAGSGGTGPAPKDIPVIPSDVLVLAAISLGSGLGALALSRRYQRVAAYISVGLVAAVGLWILAFPWIVTKMPSNY